MCLHNDLLHGIRMELAMAVSFPIAKRKTFGTAK